MRLDNGNIYLLGGWAPGTIAAPYTHNRVYKSTDGGATYRRLTDAPWEGRHTAGWATDGTRLFVVGGDMNKGHYQRDVWYAVEDGDDLDWTETNSNAAPLADGRVLHVTYWHDGKLWIVGGQTLDEFTPTDMSTKPGPSPYYDDCCSSDDFGATWVTVSTGNTWAPCGLIMNPGAVKDGYMWLIGGGAYDTEGNPRVYKNSVYRAMLGNDWELVAANGEFPARQYHNVVSFNGDLVVLMGYNGSNMADAYASSDGTAPFRKLAPLPATVTARHAASTCVINGEILLLGGPLAETSIWAMS